jgi:hypothetical protein
MLWDSSQSLTLSDTIGSGSIWVSPDSRPEDFVSSTSSIPWSSYYAEGEPDFSGGCLYLSKSRGLRWRDTACFWDKYYVCERSGPCDVEDSGGRGRDEQEEEDKRDDVQGAKVVDLCG